MKLWYSAGSKLDQTINGQFIIRNKSLKAGIFYLYSTSISIVIMMELMTIILTLSATYVEIIKTEDHDTKTYLVETEREGTHSLDATSKLILILTVGLT